jgi:hypothetical protein
MKKIELALDFQIVSFDFFLPQLLLSFLLL